VGNGVNGNGTVTVNGTNSEWSLLGNLDVGKNGTGSVDIENGGQVIDIRGNVGGSDGSGSAGNGTVTVDGTGSKWNNLAGLYVGFNGTGTLTVENGAHVTDTNGYVGENSGSNGTVTVTGAGSEWRNSASVSIGINGTGVLTVEDGGLVTAGTLSDPDPITIGANGTVTLNGGTLQGAVYNYGKLDPFASTITGSYTGENGSTLIFDVGSANGYDQIDLNNGNATFDSGSTIDIVFTNGFQPTTGETFDFFTGNGSVIGGGNANVVVSGLSNGYDINFSNGEFEITVPEPGTWALLAMSLIAMMVFAVRKRRSVLPVAL
jgi:T5SS/PEP-CTERM-associated repeat protein